MSTQETSAAPAHAVVSQSAEVYLESSTDLVLKLVVIPVKCGGWNWAVWNPRAGARLPEDKGHCDSELDAKLAAHRAAVKVMRREAERLEAEVDFVEESQPEWE